MTGFNVPQGAVVLTANASSNTGAAIAATISNVSGTVGKTIYLAGFSYQSTSATAATVVQATVTYFNAAGAVTIGSFDYPVGAVAPGTMQAPMVINLDPPMFSPLPQNGIASGAGPNIGAINISVSAPGSGATATALNVWGYSL